MKKKILLGLGTAASTIAPVISAVSCFGSSTDPMDNVDLESMGKIIEFLEGVKINEDVDWNLGGDRESLTEEKAKDLKLTIPPIGELTVTYEIISRNEISIQASLKSETDFRLYKGTLASPNPGGDGTSDREIAETITAAEINKWLVDVVKVDTTKTADAKRIKQEKTEANFKFTKGGVEFDVEFNDGGINTDEDAGTMNWMMAFRTNNFYNYVHLSGTLSGFRILSDQEKIDYIAAELGGDETLDKTNEHFQWQPLSPTDKQTLINYSKTNAISKEYGITPTYDVTAMDTKTTIVTTYELNGLKATKTTTINTMSDAIYNANEKDKADQEFVNNLSDQITTTHWDVGQESTKKYIAIDKIVDGEIVPAIKDYEFNITNDALMLDTFYINKDTIDTMQAKYTYTMDEINSTNSSTGNEHTFTIKVEKNGKSAQKSFKFEALYLNEGIVRSAMEKITFSDSLNITQNQWADVSGPNHKYLTNINEAATYGITIPAEVMALFTQSDDLKLFDDPGDSTIPADKGTGATNQVKMILRGTGLRGEGIGEQDIHFTMLMQFSD